MSVEIDVVPRDDLLARLDRLRDCRPPDPEAVFSECEDVYAEFLRACAFDPGSVTPVLVLRGGLVAHRGCRSNRLGPVGLVLPVRTGADVCVGYTDLPVTQAPVHLVADWILATGSTVQAAIEAVRSLRPGTTRVVVTCVIACEDGLRALAGPGGVQVEVRTLRVQPASAGLLLGFDIGDYALGAGDRVRRTWLDAAPSRNGAAT